MSTTILTYPNVGCDRQTSASGLIRTLIITSVILIAGAILVIVLSPTSDAHQVDRIPVAGSSPDSLPIAVQVAIPPAVEFQPGPSETPMPSAGVANQPSVVPVPVPTP